LSYVEPYGAGTSMFAIGNNELAKLPILGKAVTCWICGQKHDVEYGEKIAEDGTRQPDDVVAFFKCGDGRYVCGIKGRQLKPPKETVKYLDEYNQPISRDSDHTADAGEMVTGNGAVASTGSVAWDFLNDEIVRLKADNERLRKAIRRLAEQDATLSVCDGNVTVDMTARVLLPAPDPNGAPGWNDAIGAVREALANAGVDWDTVQPRTKEAATMSDETKRSVASAGSRLVAIVLAVALSGCGAESHAPHLSDYKIKLTQCVVIGDFGRSHFQLDGL
jgi:hypothetical protein